MTTDNKRIAGYLPPKIYDRFQQYKQDNGGLSDSKAIIKLISDHLGVSDGVTQSDLPFPITLTDAQKQELKSELKEELLSDLRTEFERMREGQSRVIEVSSQAGELIGDSASEPKQLPAQISLVEDSEPEVAQSESLWLIAGQLAKRLGVNPSTVSKRVGKGIDSFREWSSGKDPDGMAWEFYIDGPMRRFRAVGDIPSELLSQLTGQE